MFRGSQQGSSSRTTEECCAFCAERETGLSHSWSEELRGTDDMFTVLCDIMALPFVIFLLSSIFSGPIGLCYDRSTDLFRTHLWLLCTKKTGLDL